MKWIHPLLSLLVILNLLACQNPSEENTTALEKKEENHYYSEQHRNQFHFSPEANWMNDPNGMVFYEGEYHLFYQYYPDSTVWGPMHWGHAISTDMIHWQHLPIALYPDSLGYIFSGSAVVDWKNTSGFGQNGQAPLVAIFTHHDMAGEKAGTKTFQYQSIAYSNDKGRSWTKYEDNPVIPNPGIKDFRDPKVIWEEANQQWVMVFAAYDKVMIYTSPNLKDWTFTSEFGIPNDDRLWECPDLFPMKVEGSDETKWVLITSIQKQAPNGGTGTSYFVGDFDGQAFKSDYKKQYWADYGKDNYAMVTWSDIPKEDGRRLALGWMSNWQYAQVVPTQTWRSAMTLPRTLTLHKTGDRYQLRSMPVREAEALATDRIELELQAFKGAMTIANELDQSLYRFDISFKKPGSGHVGLRLSNRGGESMTIRYLGVEQQYVIDRRQAGAADFSDQFAGLHFGTVDYDHPTVDMLIYLDHAAVELFADQGQCVMTEIFFPSTPFSKIELLVEKEETMPLRVTITKLKNIWRR